MKNRIVTVVTVVMLMLSGLSMAKEENYLYGNPMLKEQLLEISLVVERSPSNDCTTEECCHRKMQQCYNEGGGTKCSDQYDWCVRDLHD